MKTKIMIIAAGLLAVSCTSAFAGGFWDWCFPTRPSGGGGGHGVPEIDALAGMATMAVVAGAALLAREKFFRK